MDRILRRELAAIARDRSSGAAELALRATRALQAWLRRRPRPSEAELEEIARALLRAQPSMAPLLRLANEVALALDTRNPSLFLARSLSDFRRILRTASAKIAAHFRKELRSLPAGRVRFRTYSYSSTVVAALARSGTRIHVVYCSESRPGLEGRRTAKALARAGIRVGFRTDADLFSMGGFGHLVVGADKILRDAFENKIGTDVLVERTFKARKEGAKKLRIWVLADTTKFWPHSCEGPYSFFPVREYPPRQLWRNPPRGVWVFNKYFCCAPFTPITRIVTERGVLTPKQVRRVLSKIAISPRLKQLVD